MPDCLDRLSAVRIVLVATSHPGNIGAAARAMHTMGLERLVLVAPRRFPDPEATALASGATAVLDDARVVASLDEALAGCALTVGFSARAREFAGRVLALREAAAEAIAQCAFGDVALVFGTEMSGLSNDELARCSVIAFAGDARVIQDAGRPRGQGAVLDELFALHGGGLTNLAGALRAASAQLRASPPGRRVAIALSDCLATAGTEPAGALSGIDCLHVLGTSAEPDAVRAGRDLARRAGGRFVLLDSVASVPRQIAPLLAS